MGAASEEALEGRKRLLSTQDEPLQRAVFEGLIDLGFDVQDMDLVWEERQHREDYRITDPDVPGWLVIGDATGVATGAKGSKIATVIGYVTKYAIEEKPDSPPSVWVLVNHLIDRDPDTRGDIYRADDLNVLVT